MNEEEEAATETATRDEEPTISNDKKDNNFCTTRMKTWSSEYEDSDEDVPASPKSSSNSEWVGEEPGKKNRS